MATVVCGLKGLAGDRQWGLMRADGTVVSAKSPRRGGALLHVAARQDSDGETWLALPTGERGLAGTPACDAMLSKYMHEPVRLLAQVPEGLRLHRLWPDTPGLVPDWQMDATPGEEVVTPVDAATDGSFVDFGSLHLVTTGALTRLRHQQGHVVDPMRFRPNLVLDLADDPTPGTRLSLGDGVVLRISFPTPRCVVPSLPQPGISEMPSLLATLARHSRQQVANLGRATCFGVYAEVESEGTITCHSAVQVSVE